MLKAKAANLSAHVEGEGRRVSRSKIMLRCIILRLRAIGIGRSMVVDSPVWLQAKRCISEWTCLLRMQLRFQQYAVSACKSTIPPSCY